MVTIQSPIVDHGNKPRMRIILDGTEYCIALVLHRLAAVFSMMLAYLGDKTMHWCEHTRIGEVLNRSAGRSSEVCQERPQLRLIERKKRTEANCDSGHIDLR